MANLRKKRKVRPVKCDICGTVFKTSHSQGKYCSDVCSREGELERSKAYSKNYRLAHRRDVAVKNKIYHHVHKKDIAERHKEYHLAHKKEIAKYHKSYLLAHKKEIAEWQKAYNKAYRLAHPEKIKLHRRKYKALKLGNNHEPYTGSYIFERDNWICGLCGRKINKRLKHPNPLSPSIDHIIPVSKGGSDSPINVQAVHLRCNLSKQAGSGGQLRLIG